jgi:hypothetical protein
VLIAKNLWFYKRRAIYCVAVLLTSFEGFGCAEFINYCCNCGKIYKIFNKINEKVNYLLSVRKQLYNITDLHSVASYVECRNFSTK